MKVGIRMKT